MWLNVCFKLDLWRGEIIEMEENIEERKTRGDDDK
jgi:hypothetical protein